MAHNSDDPNSAVGDEGLSSNSFYRKSFLIVVQSGAAILLADIADTRTMLAGMNLDKTIPVGNSDAGSYFNTKVLSAVDYGVCLEVFARVINIDLLRSCPTSTPGSPIPPPRLHRVGSPISLRKQMCNLPLCCRTRCAMVSLIMRVMAFIDRLYDLA